MRSGFLPAPIRVVAGERAGLQPIFIDTETDSISIPDDTALTHEVFHEAGTELLKMHMGQAGEMPDSAIVHRVFDAAEAGSPEALTLIGRWYEKGDVVHRDAVLASVYYLRAIRLDAPWAPPLLWKMIQRNDFFRRLKSSADQDNPAAQFAWAELFASDFDHQLTQPQALELLQRAAHREFAPAVAELGRCYYSGLWVPQSREKGMELLRHADKLGNREATVRLAMIELQGNKHSPEDTALVEVLWRAAGDGSVLAQTMLGYCYHAGLGVAQNTAQSVQLYRTAAQRGSNTAYGALKNLYGEIRPPDPEFRVDE
jgi:uncharacterized protein